MMFGFLGNALSYRQLQRMFVLELFSIFHHTLQLSFTIFHVAEYFSKFTIPEGVSLKGKEQSLWREAVVGLVHHLVVVYMVYNVFLNPPPGLNEDRIYGVADNVSLLFAISTSYFAWDISSCIRGKNTNLETWGHAVRYFLFSFTIFRSLVSSVICLANILFFNITASGFCSSKLALFFSSSGRFLSFQR